MTWSYLLMMWAPFHPYNTYMLSGIPFLLLLFQLLQALLASLYSPEVGLHIPFLFAP